MSSGLCGAIFNKAIKSIKQKLLNTVNLYYMQHASYSFPTLSKCTYLRTRAPNCAPFTTCSLTLRSNDVHWILSLFHWTQFLPKMPSFRPSVPLVAPCKRQSIKTKPDRRRCVPCLYRVKLIIISLQLCCCFSAVFFFFFFDCYLRSELK